MVHLEVVLCIKTKETECRLVNPKTKSRQGYLIRISYNNQGYFLDGLGGQLSPLDPPSSAPGRSCHQGKWCANSRTMEEEKGDQWSHLPDHGDFQEQSHLSEMTTMEDGKVGEWKIFSFPSCVFGWRGGKVGGWKTLLFGWREKGKDKKCNLYKLTIILLLHNM